MKKILLLLALLSAALTASAVTPELSGIYVEDAKALFVLVDPATGESSRWLALGQEFAGYALKAFKADADTLVLAKDGVDYPVKLRAGKVRYAATTLTGTIGLGAGKSAQVQRATLVFGQDNTFPVADGLTLTIKPALMPDGNILYKSHFDRIGADGKPEVLAAPGMVAEPNQQFSMQIDDLSFSFQP